jgi:hypothetical protein
LANKHNKPHKVKKAKGRVQPKLLIPKKIAIEEGLEVPVYWSDWDDYRDGTRDWFKDRSRYHRIVLHNRHFDERNAQIISDNNKIKRKERIRRVRRK